MVEGYTQMCIWAEDKKVENPKGNRKTRAIYYAHHMNLWEDFSDWSLRRMQLSAASTLAPPTQKILRKIAEVVKKSYYTTRQQKCHYFWNM